MLIELAFFKSEHRGKKCSLISGPATNSVNVIPIRSANDLQHSQQSRFCSRPGQAIYQTPAFNLGAAQTLWMQTYEKDTHS